jgi:hypothetical protein
MVQTVKERCRKVSVPEWDIAETGYQEEVG